MFKSQKIHFSQWLWLILFGSFYFYLYYIVKMSTPNVPGEELETSIKPILTWIIWFFIFIVGSVLFSFLGIKYSRVRSKHILEKLEKISIDCAHTQFGSSLKLPLHSLPTHTFFIESLNNFIEWKDNEKSRLLREIKNISDEINLLVG